MTTVREIKAAIEKLPLVEQSKLLDWVNDWADDAWDREMKAQMSAGRFEKKLDLLRTDIRAGTRQIERIVVLPLHEAGELNPIDDAVNFIVGYKDNDGRGAVHRYLTEERLYAARFAGYV